MAKYRKQKSGKRNSATLLVVFVALAYVIFGGPDDDQPKQRPDGSDLRQEAKNQPSEPKVWPPASTEAIQLAANPLTDNYLLMLDTSGSMGEYVCEGRQTKMDAAKQAVKSFFLSLEPNVNVGLYAFSGDVREVMPIGQHQIADFNDSVDRLSAGGGTPLQQALRISEELLRKTAQTQGGYGTYNLVLITDGHSSDGRPQALAQQIAQETAITLNAIGFCTGASHSLNIQGYTNFSTAGNAEQLVQSLSATIQAEQDVFDISDFNPDD